MRTGEAVALLFRLQLAGGPEASRDVRKFKADYVKEVRAIETIGQRALTVLSTPIRGRFGLAGSLGISTARAALRSFASQEIPAFNKAQNEATRVSDKFTSSLLTQGATTQSTKKDVALMGTALSLFSAKALQAFTETNEKGDNLRRMFKDFGVDVEAAVRRPQPEFQKFLREFRRIPDQYDRTSISIDLFGSKTSKLLPVLESNHRSFMALNSPVARLSHTMRDVVPTLDTGATKFDSLAVSTAGATKGMLSAAAGAAGFLLPIGLVVGVLAGAALAAMAFYAVMFSIAKGTAAADYEVAKLADTLGLQAENMSVLSVAAQRTGKDVTEIRESINIFNRNIAEAAAGKLPQVSALLLQLGIDAKVAAKDNDAALIQFINAYNKLENPTEKAALLQKVFSDESGKVGAILREVGGDFEAYKKQLKSAGLLMSNEAAQNAKEFQRSLRELGQQITALKNNFGRQLVPEFTRGLRLISSDVSGVGTVVTLVAGGIAFKIRETVDQLASLAALLKTVSEIRPTDPQFTGVYLENVKNLRAEMNKPSKAENEEEKNKQLDLASKREKSAADARIEALEAGLAAQKQLEENLTAEIDRQVKLRRKSTGDAMRERIDAARTTAEVEVTVIRARIAEEEKAELKEGETEANRQARIAALRVEEKVPADKFRNDEKKARAEYAEQQRQIEEQAIADSIEAARIRAEGRIQALEREIERDNSLREEHTRKIVAIEQGITYVQRKELERRIQAAGANAELRRQLEGELAVFNAEASKKHEEQQRRTREASFEKEIDALRKKSLREGAAAAGEAGTINRLRDAAERGAAQFGRTEETITRIVVEAIQRRIDALKAEIAERAKHKKDVSDLNAQLLQAEQERVNEEEEGRRRVRDGREKDMERGREDMRRILDRENGITAARINARTASLDALSRILGKERQYIDERYQIEIDRINLANDQVQADIDEREHQELLHAERTVKNKVELEEKKLAIQKKYDELRKLQQQQTDAELEEREYQKTRAKELEDPSSNRSIGGDVFGDAMGQTGSVFESTAAAAEDAFSRMSDSAGNMQSMLSGAFEGVMGGLGSMAAAFLSTGEFSVKALARMLTATLASLAAESGIKAVYEYAAGLASAAVYDFYAASQHFAAAKFYGSVALLAGGAALASRAIFGSGTASAAKSQGVGSTSLAGSGGENEAGTKYAPFNYNSGAQPSSAVAGSGSGNLGFWEKVRASIDRQTQVQAETNAQLARLQSMPPGDVVGVGLEQNPRAAGVAVIEHSNSSHQFNMDLLNNMGFAR